MIRAPSRTTRRAGFTLLETVIALVIFMALGYGLSIAALVGSHSEREVSRLANENRSLRESVADLANELQGTSDANVSTTVLSDGNTQLRLMMPIVDAGVNSWGVYDRRLGATPALQNRANWLVQYTVRNAPSAGGGTEKQLVRQVLDLNLAVQLEDVLAHGLRGGAVTPPGFNVAMNGAMWAVTLSTDGPLNGKLGQSTVFHVKTRN